MNDQNIRLSLVVPKTVKKRLVRLKTASKSTSYAETLRRALAMYELVLNEVEAGPTLIIHRENGIKAEVKVFC